MDGCDCEQNSTSLCLYTGIWVSYLYKSFKVLIYFVILYSNWFLNFSIILETVVALVLVYVPHLNTALTFKPVGFRPWLCGLPFFLYFLCYEVKCSSGKTKTHLNRLFL